MTQTITAPLQSLVIEIAVRAGDRVVAGQTLLVLEAMKMQHPLYAPSAARVLEVSAHLHKEVMEGQVLIKLEAEASGDTLTPTPKAPPSERADLATYQKRHSLTQDEARPEAIGKRHAKGFRSARENIADLCDTGSFIEYGAFALAAQRKRRALDDLIANTPADGIITGFGSVGADLVGAAQSQTAVLAYDYTVLAGTQGAFNHKKTDRVLELAAQWKTPIVFFTEGGGGRPGDTDMADISVAGLDIKTFATYARAASGAAPTIAVNNGYCFAGNAVLFGVSDFRIATKNSWIGMGGPVMIEGGGLGSFSPKEIGDTATQTANGVIDILVPDETEAVQVAKKLLSCFQGRTGAWTAEDQSLLRDVVPENRKQVYDVMPALKCITDLDSFIEIQKDFGKSMMAGFARVEGAPVAVLANNPKHLGGAIDAQAAEKAARLLRLAAKFNLPLLSLCDTPGFMVGPESEKQACVRYAGDMMTAAAGLSTPVFMVCLRKGYGLGAQAMAAGSFHASFFSVAWPSGEFGGMGLEGAVRLGYSKELAAQKDEAAKQALFDKLLAKFYERGSALSMAQVLEIDAVIDPQDTRSWITQGLKTSGYYF